MGFRNQNAYGKSREEKKLEEDRGMCLRLEEQIIARTKKILSRQFIRDADHNLMVNEKDALEKDQNELGKMRRSIARREGNLK